MSRLDKIAEGLLRPINPYATSILGLLTATWGLWVIMPFWSVFGKAELFEKMREFAPELAWGSWAFVCGLLIIYAIYAGRYRTLSAAMAFASWHWTTVACMMWWGDWQNTGGLTYSWIAVYSIYVYLNVRINLVKFPDGTHF